MARVQPVLDAVRRILARLWQWSTIQHVTALVLLQASLGIVLRPSGLSIEAVSALLRIPINHYLFAILFALSGGMLIREQVSSSTFILATLPLMVYALIVVIYTWINPNSSLVVGILLFGYWLTIQVLNWRLAVSDGDRSI